MKEASAMLPTGISGIDFQVLMSSARGATPLPPELSCLPTGISSCSAPIVMGSATGPDGASPQPPDEGPRTDGE